MVLAGQFLERPALIDAGGLTLEGLSHRGVGRPGLLVCPPIGEGGGMDAPVVAELAWAAARAGLPSLRFQHRGVGASQGAPDAASAVDDALAALDHLLASVGGPVAVAGVGGGAATACALALRRPDGLAGLLVVDPRPPLEPLSLAQVTLPRLVLLPESGAAWPASLLALQAGGGSLRVEVIPGADPGFRARLPQAGRSAVAWLVDRR